jgi:hypothetical protein
VKAAARALALIRPKSKQRRACAAAVALRIKILRAAAQDVGAIPAPGALKTELKEIVRDLQRTKRTFAKRSVIARAVTFWKDAEQQQAFLAVLDQAIEAAQFHHDALVIPAGSPQFDNVKAAAASCAAELLRCYGTGRGRRELAELLYQAATGKAASLEQYCRQLGRIEPSPLFKMQFAKRR